MNTQWLDSSSDRLRELATGVSAGIERLSDPARQRRLKQGLIALAAIWMVFGLVDLVWSLVPTPSADGEPAEIVNPLIEPAQPGRRLSVNIEELVQWNLFGTAATAPATISEEELRAAAASDNLDGIENTAKETRLDLTLQGVVASSDAEQARAIIEAKKEQKLYLVGDELPVGNKVKVAKILSDRVVIDNAGKYELLMLFDEDDFSVPKTRTTASRPATQSRKPARAASRAAGRANTAELTKMAENYRQRLYNNPQSLAQVVKIAAVRDNGQLTGYRVSAGRDREQFEALGFQANDVVTGVNGVELTDPGKAIKLYEVMRTAKEATFEVLRNGEQVTLSVGLETAADDAAQGPEDD